MSGKVKVSKEEFAEVLLHWFALNAGRKGIEQDAKVYDLISEGPLESREAKELFGLSLSNRAEFSILVEELIALNIWIIVHTCEMTLKDVEKRNDCLDIFHRRLFDRFFREAGDDFEQWLLFLTVKYGEYREAIKTDLSTLAYLILRNLHGDDALDAIVQFHIGLYVAENIKALRKALDQYEIE
jgi:hypothetical protein